MLLYSVQNLIKSLLYPTCERLFTLNVWAGMRKYGLNPYKDEECAAAEKVRIGLYPTCERLTMLNIRGCILP